MNEDVEGTQLKVQQMIQARIQEEKLKALENKIQKVVKDIKEVEEQDMEYENKIVQLGERRVKQMQSIEELKDNQTKELRHTLKMYEDLKSIVNDFQAKQNVFIAQQKRDRDMLKSFQKTRVARSAIIEANQSQFVSVQNPFVLLSEAQGLLDSQYDEFYHNYMRTFDKLLNMECTYPSCQIVMTIISYKPDLPSVELFQERQYQGISQQVPLKMHFLIDFYDFPTYKTDNIVYQHCPTVDELREYLAHECDLTLVYEGYQTNKQLAKQACFSFDVDMDSDFLKYILFKSVYVRMIDSITGENIGYCQVPLHHLLRGEDAHIYRLVEAQVLSYDWTVVYGTLSFTIQSRGTQSTTAMENTASNFMKTTKSQFFHESKLQKSKIVSIKPIDFNETSKRPMVSKQIVNVKRELRMKTRINQIKVDSLTYLSKTHDEFVKQVAVQQSRIANRQSLIQGVLSHEVTTVVEISIKVGSKHIEQLQFQNPFDQITQFNISVNDPMVTLPEGDELELLYNQQEIHKDTRVFLEDQQFTIDSKQSVILMVSFYTKLDFEDKKITLLIKKKNTPINGQVYDVKYAQQIIDLTLEFQQALSTQHQQVHQYKVPPLFCFIPPTQRQQPTIVVDSNKAILSLDNQQYLVVSMKSLDHQAIQTVNIFFYRDQYKHELLLCLRINVQSLPFVQVCAEMGKTQNLKLEMKFNANRRVYLHSLNKMKVWFDLPYDQPFDISKDTLMCIPYRVFQMTQNKQEVKVNAMDSNTNELIYSWLISISSTIPTITQVHRLKCNYMKILPFKLMYRNPLPTTIHLTLTTSSYLLKAIISNYSIKGNSKVELDLCVQVAQEYTNQELNAIEQKREVMLFLYDQVNAIFECHLFQLYFYDYDP